MATKFPDVVLRPFAQDLVQHLRNGTGTHFAYFLNDLEAEAPRTAKRYAQIVAEIHDVSVKELFGGFRPVWTRRSADIASFFKPPGRADKRKAAKEQSILSDHEKLRACESENIDKHDENGSFVTQRLPKEGRHEHQAVEAGTLSLKPAIDKPKASPVRTKASAKKRVRSIEDYFPVRTDDLSSSHR